MMIQGLPESPITGVHFRNVSFSGTSGSPGICGHTNHAHGPCPIPGTCHIVPCGKKGEIWGACEHVRPECARVTYGGALDRDVREACSGGTCQAEVVHGMLSGRNVRPWEGEGPPAFGFAAVSGREARRRGLPPRAEPL